MLDISTLPFDALMIDIDECLTRLPDRGAYGRAMHAAIVELCGEQRLPCDLSLDAYLKKHEALHFTGLCMQTAMAEAYGLDPVKLFDRFHDRINETGIEHDVDSGRALRQLAEQGMPLVKLTDGAPCWAGRRSAHIGANLAVVTRRGEGELIERKATGAAMWLLGESALAAQSAWPLRRARIAMVDDSAAALRRAQAEGFGTVQIHYAFPDRAPNPEFDFNAASIADFLHDAGYLPRPAVRVTSRAPAA